MGWTDFVDFIHIVVILSLHSLSHFASRIRKCSIAPEI